MPATEHKPFQSPSGAALFNCNNAETRGLLPALIPQKSYKKMPSVRDSLFRFCFYYLKIFGRRNSAKIILDISRRIARFGFVFTAGDARSYGARSRCGLFIRKIRTYILDVICRNCGNYRRRFYFTRIFNADHLRSVVCRRNNFRFFYIYGFRPDFNLRNCLVRRRRAFRSRSVFARCTHFRSARDYYPEKLTFL